MRNDLSETLSLIALAAAHVRAIDYQQRARQLQRMAADENDPTLRSNLLVLAAEYRQLAA